MSENNIYEITQMISNRKTLQNDLSEAMQTINSMFKTKYIDKLQNVVQAHQTRAKNNPSKEVQLMYALKPFLDKSKYDYVDKLIDTLISFNAIKQMHEELTTHSKQDIKIASVIEEQIDQKDKSIQEDGIYDIDENCIKLNKNNCNVPKIDVKSLILLFIFSIMI